MPTQQPIPLTQSIAKTILDGFNLHFEMFQQITTGARGRFEQANWHAVQQASRERIVLYDRRVKETISLLKQRYSREISDAGLWKKIKLHYMRSLLDHHQPELAETFYTSVFCRQFPQRYYTNDYIFMRSAISTEYINPQECTYRSYYPNATGLKQALSDVLNDAAFTLPYENLQRDVHAMIRQVLREYPDKANRKTDLNYQLKVIHEPFFRNKAAYLVGRIINGRNDIPFAIPILNNEKGGLFVDALLLGERQLSVVFSYSQAYFMITHRSPARVVSFLRYLLPRRNTSELYSAIGLHKQGKSAFYRDFLHHLRHSSDQFIIAPGIRGMVMMVFTLPSYPYVFKIIKDKFAPQKEFTRQQVAEKYQLVKRHDRVGRMADMLEYSMVTLPTERFAPELLDELKKTCASSLEWDDEQITITHLYLERRMTPLNMYIESANEEELEHAIQDYGEAIKQLAAANIFPGDFLYKNFGMTYQNRVVFYDYDEISYMTECNFRKIPPPRTPEDMFSAEPWYSVEPNDVFPEEFATFLLTDPRIRKIFMKHHKDLLTAAYWQEKKDNIMKGLYEDVYPYAEDLRFKR